MSSKEQLHGNDIAGSKQRSPKPDTENSEILAPQYTHPATIIPRAKLDLKSPTPNDVLQLQHTIGNQAVSRLFADTGHRQTTQKNEKMNGLPEDRNVYAHSAKPAALALSGSSVTRPLRQPAYGQQTSIQRQFEAEGRTGEAPLAGVSIENAGKAAALEEDQESPWGEKEGVLTSDISPHVFVNGGKTGSALDNTVGGQGGTGNQTVAAITLVAPIYESAPPSGGTGAKAWIRPGTGTARVVRSYTGSLVGANGPTLYMTPAAVARTDQHEVLHVVSSMTIHNTHILLLEIRIAQHTGQANALVSGTTTAQAEAALQAFISWNTTISAFRRADTAANTPMGTVDVADLASPTFIRDYGPRTVGRVRYAHYFDVPPGP